MPRGKIWADQDGKEEKWGACPIFLAFLFTAKGSLWTEKATDTEFFVAFGWWDQPSALVIGLLWAPLQILTIQSAKVEIGYDPLYK